MAWKFLPGHLLFMQDYEDSFRIIDNDMMATYNFYGTDDVPKGIWPFSD